VLPNVPQCLIQRGNSHIACFYADEDDVNYLDWREEHVHRAECQIHVYVFMTNHIYLLVSAQKAEAIGRMMKYAEPPTATMRWAIQSSCNKSPMFWEGACNAAKPEALEKR
jgi:REP element-mobilizing transposase RayT